MTYFVLEVQNDSATLIYKFSDDDPGATIPAIDRAKAKFHEIMAYTYLSPPGRESTLAVVLDTIGGIIVRERWVKPAVPETGGESE